MILQNNGPETVKTNALTYRTSTFPIPRKALCEERRVIAGATCHSHPQTGGTLADIHMGRDGGHTRQKIKQE